MLHGQYFVECVAADGATRWRERVHNIVTYEGRNALLDAALSGDAYTASCYLGLISSVGYTAAPSVTDTLASHAQWFEAGAGIYTPTYGTASRPQISWGAASGTKVFSPSVTTNVFNGPGSVKGCFITFKGATSQVGATAGSLFSVAAFPTAKDVLAGDALRITYTLALTEPAPLNPVINSFTCADVDILLDQQTTVSWETTNATTVTLNGSSVSVDAVNYSVRPTTVGTTTYTLVASGAAGTAPVTSSLQVVVTQAQPADPVINSFTCSDNSITQGESTMLSWATTNATSVTLNGVARNLNQTNFSVSPTTTTVYTLVATGAAGTTPDTRTLTVTVTAVVPPPTYSGNKVQLAESITSHIWADSILHVPWGSSQVNVSPAIGTSDWSDALGVMQGATPYASYTLTQYARVAFTLDVTAMMGKLLAENTGFTLRLLSGNWAYASSYQTDVPSPSLLVNGVVCPLLQQIPLYGWADANKYYLSSPSILKFDLSNVSAPIMSAVLTLWSYSVWSGGVPGTLGVFYAESPTIISDPALQLGGVEYGIAQDVLVDTDLAEHADVIAYSDLGSTAQIGSDLTNGWWTINNYSNSHGSTDPVWTYDPGYVQWPEYGITVGRAKIPAGEYAISGMALQRWAGPYRYIYPSWPDHTWLVPFSQLPDELYFRYVFRLDPDCEAGVRQGQGVKMPDLMASFDYDPLYAGGHYYTSDGVPCDAGTPGAIFWPNAQTGTGWSYRTEFNDRSATNPGYMGQTFYYYDIDAPIGTGSGGVAYPRWTLKVGKKYTCEWRVKLNTQNPDGSWNRDGIVTLWADGVKVFDDHARMIRQDPWVKFQAIPRLALYHGGGLGPAADIHIEIGAVAIATRYIGPPKVQTPVISGRPAWAANAPLNTWIDVDVAGSTPTFPLGGVRGTTFMNMNLPPTAAACGYSKNLFGGMLSAWNGPSIQQAGAILHVRLQGGHQSDGWFNFGARIVLGAEVPYIEWVDWGTDAGNVGTDGLTHYDWYTNATYLPVSDPGKTGARFKPSVGHCAWSHVFCEPRQWDMVFENYGTDIGAPMPPPTYPYIYRPDLMVPPLSGSEQNKWICAYDVAEQNRQLANGVTTYNAYLSPGTIRDKSFGSTSEPVAVHPVTGDVFFGAQTGIWRWNCADPGGPHTQLGNAWAYPHAPFLLDSANNVLLQLGGDPWDVLLPYTCDLTTGAFQRPITLTGAQDDVDHVQGKHNATMHATSQNVMENKYCAAEFGAGSIMLLTTSLDGATDVTSSDWLSNFNGQGYARLYLVQRVNATTYNVSLYNTVNRVHNAYNGNVYSQFHYSTQLGGFLFWNRIDEPVKFLRVI